MSSPEQTRPVEHVFRLRVWRAKDQQWYVGSDPTAYPTKKAARKAHGIPKGVSR